MRFIPSNPPKNRKYLLWSEEEKQWLIFHWDDHNITELATILGRTEVSIEDMGRKLKLYGRKETKSLCEVAHITGYTRATIKRAVHELGLKIRRAHKMNVRKTGPTVTYAFSEGQIESITKYLTQFPDGIRRMKTTGQCTVRGAWGMGKKPAACISHGKADRPHFAKGMCSACYARYRYAIKHKKAA